MKENPLNLEDINGYPAGKNIVYECKICNTTLNSFPEHFASCECENIEIDATVGRIFIKDKSKFLIIRSNG